jgi:hypothetical protein
MGLHIEYMGLVILAFTRLVSDRNGFNMVATSMIELGIQHAIYSLIFLNWVISFNLVLVSIYQCELKYYFLVWLPFWLPGIRFNRLEKPLGLGLLYYVTQLLDS